MSGLRELNRFLHTLNSWKGIGLELGLGYHTLQHIQKENPHSVDECRMEMLETWLRQADNVATVGVPSWQVLKAALQTIGENELASRI